MARTRKALVASLSVGECDPLGITVRYEYLEVNILSGLLYLEYLECTNYELALLLGSWL
jgi:hypothetical protein